MLVSKFPFDNGHFGRVGTPNRFDVVVFKYPVDPQKGQMPMNYIKRLCGLPGETIAIFNGDLYVCDTIDYSSKAHPRPDDAQELWKESFTYSNDEAAVNAFHAGRFQILRKSPELILAMQRLVYDNDHQAQDLIRPRQSHAGRTAAVGRQATRQRRGFSATLAMTRPRNGCDISTCCLIAVMFTRTLSQSIRSRSRSATSWVTTPVSAPTAATPAGRSSPIGWVT